MRKLILIAFTFLLGFATQAQDSIRFMPVFYKQCNANLIKTDSVEIRVEYRVYSATDEVIGMIPFRVQYTTVPDEIVIPKNASNVELYVNELLELEPNPDSMGTWRDTFYIQHPGRYYEPFWQTHYECGELSHGEIKRLTLTGEVEEIDVYDNGILLSKTTYHDNGEYALVGKGLNKFDSNYSIKRYNPNGNVIYEQTHEYTAMYNYSGVKLVEIEHPLYTKKQIRKKYRRKLKKYWYKQLRYEGKEPKKGDKFFQPCIARTYFEKSGKLLTEGEYLVPLNNLANDVFGVVDLLLIQRYGWGNIVPLWVKQYDEDGNFIYKDLNK